MNKANRFCTIALCLSGIATGALAQNTDDEMENYSRLTVNLVAAQPVSQSNGVTMVSNHNLYGTGLGYVFGLNLTGHRLPLFLEVGPECSFTRHSDEIDYWDEDTMTSQEEVSTKMLTLSSPIDVAYHIHLSRNLVLAPAAGMTAKVNLRAKTESAGHTIDLIDEGANRFQWGWNTGLGLYLHRFYVGLHFQQDITPFISERQADESYQSFDVKLGLRF